MVRPRAFVIAGPTSAGKTALAIDVAREFGAVVLSADAMQVYRGMDIGTGKANASERAGVVHLGIDLREPDEPFDVGDFLQVAHEALSQHARVVVCGGTALYHKALRRGLVQTPAPDLERRRFLEGQTDLHERLEHVDPALASRLHPNDAVRLIRGIEVFEGTGVALSTLQARHAAAEDLVEVRGIWLDRDDLDSRIDERVLEMIAGGYVEEVDRLLARFDRSNKPLRSLGYRHLASHLLDALPLDEAIRLTQRDTRRFARKQRTWRKQLGLEAAGDPHTLAQELWGRL